MEALLDDGGVDPKDFLDRVTDWRSDLAALGFHREMNGNVIEHQYHHGPKVLSVVDNKDGLTVNVAVWRKSANGFWYLVTEDTHVPVIGALGKVRGLLWKYFKKRVN